jgi:hypothetical protein
MQHMAVEEGRILPIQSHMHALALFHSRTAHKQAKLHARKCFTPHWKGKASQRDSFQDHPREVKMTFQSKKSINEQLRKDGERPRERLVQLRRQLGGVEGPGFRISRVGNGVIKQPPHYSLENKWGRGGGRIVCGVSF